MRIRMISFTQKGAALSRMIQDGTGDTYKLENTAMPAYAKEAGERIQPLKNSLREWTAEAFAEADAIIYIGACGIAVRSIAPFLIDKSKDPAVIVIDESGKFCISLLSGHVGGANAITQQLAALLEAIPVITTATDLRGCFAIDNYSSRKGLYCEPSQLCKEVSVRLLNEQKVAVASDFIIEGDMPQGLVEQKGGAFGIYFTTSKKVTPFDKTLYVMPKIIFLGIGCKKNTPFEEIESVVFAQLDALCIPIQTIAAIASISNKKEEKGLLQFCQKHHLTFLTYTSEELQAVCGVFTESEFVKKTVGVDNVCERAAVKASGGGELLLEKQMHQGITIAMAVQKWSVQFE